MDLILPPYYASDFPTNLAVWRGELQKRGRESDYNNIETKYEDLTTLRTYHDGKSQIYVLEEVLNFSSQGSIVLFWMCVLYILF